MVSFLYCEGICSDQGMSAWLRQDIALSIEVGWSHTGAATVATEGPPRLSLARNATRTFYLTGDESAEGGQIQTPWKVLVGDPNALLFSHTKYTAFWSSGEDRAPLHVLSTLPILAQPRFSDTLRIPLSDRELMTAVALPRRMTRAASFAHQCVFKDPFKLRQATRTEQCAFEGDFKSQAPLAFDVESDEWWKRRDLTETVPGAVHSIQSSASRMTMPQLADTDRRRNDAKISNPRAKLTMRNARARREADSEESVSDDETNA